MKIFAHAKIRAIMVKTLILRITSNTTCCWRLPSKICIWLFSDTLRVQLFL